MATLASQIFAKSGRNDSEEDELLKLFWNRAQLKKELDKLRNKNYLLGDELKQEQAVKLRVQQRFEQLESMLANPATASVAITYFQLRDVWNRCHARLDSVAREMSKSRYEKEYRSHVASFRRHVYKSLTGVQSEMDTVHQTGDTIGGRIRTLRQERGASRGFWNYFKRRRLTTEIDELRSRRRNVSVRLADLTHEIQAKASVDPPEFDGLDIRARRAINLTLIAYAQEFYLLFADLDVAVKARESSILQVGDVRYGDRRDCRELRTQIELGTARLENDSELHERVRMRVAHLESTVLYRRDGDTIPAAEVLQTLSLFKKNGKTRGELAVNVLADEYWDLYPLLLP